MLVKRFAYSDIIFLTQVYAAVQYRMSANHFVKRRQSRVRFIEQVLFQNY